MAKPIIDLIPVATDLQSLDRVMPRVEELGYECLGEFGLAGRRYCRRNDPSTGKRAYQLHCYAEGFPEIERHLAFAHYLRAHPEIAKDYEAEKLRAAALHPDNTLNYNDAKNDWIKRTEQDACGGGGRAADRLVRFASGLDAPAQSAGPATGSGPNGCMFSPSAMDT